MTDDRDFLQNIVLLVGLLIVYLFINYFSLFDSENFFIFENQNTSQKMTSADMYGDTLTSEPGGFHIYCYQSAEEFTNGADGYSINKIPNVSDCQGGDEILRVSEKGNFLKEISEVKGPLV